MTKKVMWLVLSCLIVTALVLASCSSDTTTDTTTDTPTDATADTPTDTPGATAGPGMVTDSLGRTVEEPQYGGTITYVSWGINWHPLGSESATYDYIMEGMFFWDFTRGPSGTGEFPMNGYGGGGTLEDYVGGLIESWEQPTLETAILHVRQGVRWQNGPLLNGRELVADDIVYSINAVQAYSDSLLYTAPGAAGWVPTAVDKYTVRIVFEAPKLRTLGGLIGYLLIIPPEVEAEGLNWNSWKTVVGTGTGPYILEDVVEGSSLRLARNPNYWRSDPLHPENKLPYPDYIKGLVIEDVSTQVAALRTAQIDYLGVGFAQVANLKKTSPELVYVTLPGFDEHIYLRQDQGYFVDRNVRYAMNMAVDPEAIIRDLYGGDGEWWNFPYSEFCVGRYTALEDMPADVQEIYTYNPEKARQLLAEAGYPNGFKIETIAYSTMVDILSIYKQYFADVGIELTIKLVDYGNFWNIASDKEWEVIASAHGASCTGAWTLLMDGDAYWNYSVVDDKHIEEVLEGLPSEVLEREEYDRQMKELGVYWAREAKYMNLPVTSSFKFWQPWLKRQSGEFSIGTTGGYSPSLIYAWIDQDLKFEMTGER